MQAKQINRPVSVAFDEPNLIGLAGLLPVMRLAETAGLSRLVGAHVRVPTDKGAHAPEKVAAVIAGMVAGADSIDDLDVLRHGAMTDVFGWSPAPSTIGSFLRKFTWGHANQLDAVASRLLVSLAATTPLLNDRPGGCASGRVLVDFDDTIVEVHGHAKQGAGIGYSHVRGLNAILATLTTPDRAPVIAASRLRRGPANSTRGIQSFVRTTLTRVSVLQPASPVLVRADSAFYNRNTIGTVIAAGGDVSVTVRTNPQVTAAIAGIPDTAWQPITYLHPVPDPDTGQPVSHAEVTEVPFTAFAKAPKTAQVTGRLIVRRVTAFTPKHTTEQTLFDTFRYHAFFTTVPTTETDTISMDRLHRAHAIIEQVHADLKNGPLKHLPSGRFAANTAWLTLATIAFNLTRAAGTIAAGTLTRATNATIRRRLITIPARIAHSARRITLHLPTGWHWETAFLTLHAPPTPTPA